MACKNCGSKRDQLRLDLQQQKLTEARNKAKAYAIQEKKTQAIYKTKDGYNFCDATASTGRTTVEFISYHN